MRVIPNSRPRAQISPRSASMSFARRSNARHALCSLFFAPIGHVAGLCPLYLCDPPLCQSLHVIGAPNASRNAERLSRTPAGNMARHCSPYNANASGLTSSCVIKCFTAPIPSLQGQRRARRMPGRKGRFSYFYHIAK